jgi:hypothetical protein
MELPKTSGKIPHVGTWNENILPPEVKERCDAARNVNRILTCALINSPYHYPADDGKTGIAPGSTMAPVIHVSKTYWHPSMYGALIDGDGKFLQPNFDPERFIKTASRLTDIRGGLTSAWYTQLRDKAFDHGLWFPAYKFFNDRTPANFVTFGSGPTDLLPGHLSGLLSRWSACLATALRKPTTLPDIHPAKKTVLAMDSGFDMIIPIVRHTHPMHATSHALSMNAPVEGSYRY